MGCRAQARLSGAALSLCMMLAMLLLLSFLKGAVRGPPGDVTYPHRSILEGRQEEGLGLLGLRFHMSLTTKRFKHEDKKLLFSPKARITIISRVSECYYHVKFVCQPSQNVCTLTVVPSA